VSPAKCTVAGLLACSSSNRIIALAFFSGHLNILALPEPLTLSFEAQSAAIRKLSVYSS